MKNQNNKKVILTVMFVAILTIVVIGTSFAFFNYTRTGSANTLKVGRISFNHTQDGNITLTNIFPMSSEEFENSTQDPSNNVTINIEGDTTYPNGVEYLVTAEDVHITVNDKRIPLTLKVTSTTDLGDNDEDYFTNRGGSTNIHKVLSGGVVVDGQYLVVGYIAPGQTGVEGSLNISAYINSDNIVISDTYDGTESDNMGTTNEWVGNKTVFTTSEWNSLSTSSNSLSFKIRVEANEGIWVEEATTPNLMNYINFNKNAVNIKEIRFIEETPLRMQRRYDASVGQESNGTKADLTYQETGKVLAWIEPVSVNPTGTSSNLNIKPSFLVNENTNNNLKQIDNETSYILYIASSGKTKWVYTGTSNIFSGFTNVEKIVFENFDTSSVPIMNDMFKDLSKLTSVNMTALDTSGVYQMTGLFSGCSSLTNIDLSGLGSNNLNAISNMFYNCNALTEIIMKNFNFGHVNFNQSFNNYTNYYYAFAYLPNVETIDLTNANTSGVTNMFDMFYNCKKLRNIIGLNTLDTSNVTNMGYMFGGCSSLIKLDLSGLGGNSLTNVTAMFGGCTSLTNINMSNFNFGLTEGLGGLFSIGSTNNIMEIKLTGSKMNNVTNMSGMFNNCTSLVSIDLSGLGSNSLTNVSEMFSGCSSLTTINMSNFNFGVIESLNFDSNNGLFSHLSNLETINLNGAKTNSIKDISWLFSGCSKLISADLSNMGSNNLLKIYAMFYNCNSLKEIVMEGFNFGNLDFSYYTNYYYAFSRLPNVETINLKNANMSGVTNMQSMFNFCEKLKTVILDGVDTGNVTYMGTMFNGCTNLTSIDISSFDMSNVTDMHNMFSGCTNLEKIYVSNIWNTSNVTNSDEMFSGCTSLVGGNGTVFDSTKIDKTMAVIDTPSTPGYLTVKTN